MDETGILSLMPRKHGRKYPFYENPHYQKSLANTVELLDYVESSNPVFNAIHHSGHRFAARQHYKISPEDWLLDAGSGNGAHLNYYRHPSRVICIDINADCLSRIRKRSPEVVCIQGDISSLPFRDDSLRYVISIYNLEHLFHLEKSLEEMARALNPRGNLIASIPCEGGLLWGLGRSLTTSPHFSRKWGINYGEVIKIEHCNRAYTVFDAINKFFKLSQTEFFPFPFIRSIGLNLICSFTGSKR